MKLLCKNAKMPLCTNDQWNSEKPVEASPNFCLEAVGSGL
jgi:hypothetical protein